MSPKISVLVPLYNRKHYIAQAIDSALNQTFTDYEIIVRDDSSTDGSADFVAERYAAEISSGKLKLRRNEKNLGEFPTDNRLLREATGEYIMMLHSDDLYLPHALEQMYTIAETFNADVVHESVYLTTAPDGVIEEGTPLKLVAYDRNQAKKIGAVSDEPLSRFNEWDLGGTGIDAQHNLFKREFLTDNDLRFESFGGNRLFALQWIMAAKILVKTPAPFYIYRNSPDSTEIQYRARSHLFLAYDNYSIQMRGVYKDGVTPELNQAVADAFRKYFGEDATYPTFLFHWINAVSSTKKD